MTAGAVTAQVVAGWLTTLAADGLHRGPSAVLAGLRSVSGLAAPRVVDAGLAVVLRAQVDRLWARGWLPVDLVEVARRQGSALAAVLVVDAMADTAAQYSAAVLHPRFRAQLSAVGAAERWWDPGVPYPGVWAARHGVDRETALATALELVGVALRLPALQVIVPPPGQASGSVDDGVSGAAGPGPGPGRPGPSAEKMLGRVRALLAKAESTSFPEEAEALSAKAQELMSRYSIEQALAEQALAEPWAGFGRGRAAVAAARRVWLDAPYLGPKTLLVAEVGSANRCRTVSSEKLGFVTVLGAEADLDVVEVLATSLLVQAARAMLASGSQYSRLGTSRTRSFRHSFLLSYATRIGERLRETAAHAAAATGTDLVPLFADRSRAADTLFDSLFATTARRSFSAGNAAGWGAGRGAADRAVLTTERRAVRRS